MMHMTIFVAAYISEPVATTKITPILGTLWEPSAKLQLFLYFLKTEIK